MPNRDWLERVRDRLHGLPPRYAERLLRELRDHAEDLGLSIDSEDDLEAILGDPEAIAREARLAYRRRTFAGRHPCLGLVLAPVVVLVFAWAGYTIVADGVLQLASGCGEGMTRSLAPPLAALPAFALPVIFLRLVGSRHRESGRPAVWYYLGCGVLLLLAATSEGVFETDPAREVSVGVELFRPVSELQWAQSLVALACWLYLCRRRDDARRTLSS